MNVLELVDFVLTFLRSLHRGVSKLVQAELQEMVIWADALINMLENGLRVIPVTLLIHI